MKQQRGSSNYSTPPELIIAIKGLLHIDEFAHDFAADATNTKAPTWFSEGTDALKVHNWAAYCNSGWGWLNPPYKNIEPWAEKSSACSLSGGRIAMLVPASVGSGWFRDHVYRKALVIFLNGRVDPYPKDCMLCLYDDTRTGYSVWPWKQVKSS